jgi:hypothetical protein
MVVPMDNKKCSRCKIVKPRSTFSRASKEPDGLQYHCKECDAKAGAAYRAANPDKAKARHRKYAAENPDKVKAQQQAWAEKNPDKVRAKSRKYYHSHKEHEAARMKAWTAKNPDWKKNYTKKWRLANIDHCKAYDAQYWRNNKPLVYAKSARRRAALLRAIPSWADHDKIAAIYAQCIETAEATGIEYHVDHIVPLRSKIVCGLHCEGNLQILTGLDNSKKHNSYWPDMP